MATQGKKSRDHANQQGRIYAESNSEGNEKDGHPHEANPSKTEEGHGSESGRSDYHESGNIVSNRGGHTTPNYARNTGSRTSEDRSERSSGSSGRSA